MRHRYIWGTQYEGRTQIYIWGTHDNMDINNCFNKQLLRWILETIDRYEQFSSIRTQATGQYMRHNMDVRQGTWNIYTHNNEEQYDNISNNWETWSWYKRWCGGHENTLMRHEVTTYDDDGRHKDMMRNTIIDDNVAEFEEYINQKSPENEETGELCWRKNLQNKKY